MLSRTKMLVLQNGTCRDTAWIWRDTTPRTTNISGNHNGECRPHNFRPIWSTASLNTRRPNQLCRLDLRTHGTSTAFPARPRNVRAHGLVRKPYGSSQLHISGPVSHMRDLCGLSFVSSVHGQTRAPCHLHSGPLLRSAARRRVRTPRLSVMEGDLGPASHPP